MDTDRNNALQLVKEFTAEILGGEVEKFLDFDFRTVENSEKYGCPKRGFDCDDTQIMRAVYIVLWGDKFPELRSENIGTGKLYRGDTLNTFHTVYGKVCEDRDGFFQGLERYQPDDRLREKAREYLKKVSTLGNFWVLPNIKAAGETLNTLRGTNRWRDFIDRFLMAEQGFFNGRRSADKRFDELMAENGFFFDNYTGQAGFEQLMKECFMDDYLDADGNAAEFFILNYHWKNPGKRDEYLVAADKFQETAGKLIAARGKRLVSALKQLLA